MYQIGQGKLKIFFSYAESIGKTQAMLKAALSVKEQGTDVIVGYIASHTPTEKSDYLMQLIPIHLKVVIKKGIRKSRNF